MRKKAAPKTASKAEQARDPFAFGDALIDPGSTRVVDLPIARLPAGTWSSMPVAVVHGARPGPTVWLSAAIHGDEVNGVEIVRRVLVTLDPKQLAGTVLAVPIVNVFGVTMGSRYLPDNRDLNRSFPGSKRGSLASRLAHLFFESVASRCELGIDFHTGSGGRCNLPHLRCDLDDPPTRELAEGFGVSLLLHATLRDGSLRAAARKQGVHVLLYEAGEAGRFDSAGILTGVEGTLRVFRQMGMVAAAPSFPGPAPDISRSSGWVRAGRSGFCTVSVRLGQPVAAGDEVAVITDGVSKSKFIVRARAAGIVIGIQCAAVVHKGDAVVHIAKVTQ